MVFTPAIDVATQAHPLQTLLLYSQGVPQLCDLGGLLALWCGAWGAAPFERSGHSRLSTVYAQ